VIELSDDEYGEIPDDEMLKAVALSEGRATAPVKKPPTQTKLGFQPAPRPASAPKATLPTKTVGGPLRAGKNKESRDDAKVQAFLEKRKAEKAALQKKKEAALATKPKTAVLESSDEDSSSEDEGNTLFKLGSRTKIEVKDAKITQAPKAPIRRLPVIKRVKDTRARIAPDMSQLYKQIFKWDFFHDDAFPPGLSINNYTHVAKSFSTFGAYQKTFEPLLLLEAWQSFLKSKEEAMPNGCLELTIATRMRSDHFVELETTIEIMPDRHRWFESDVVLLSSSKDPLKNTGEPHCIARVFTVNRKFTGKSEVSLRCDPGPIMLQNHMRNGGVLYGVKIMR
jgi:senataxin